MRARSALRLGPEAGVVAWGAGAFAATLAGTLVLRPVRDAFAIQGDPAFIPWLFTATFVAMLVLAPAWGRLIGRWPRRRFVALAFHVSAAGALAFFALVRAEVSPTVVAYAFYIWSAVTNLFVVSVFWSVCADALGPDAARRLYGGIAAGGSVGSLAGPVLTKLILRWFGVAGVLIACAILLEIARLAIAGFERAARRLPDAPAAAPPEPVAGGALDGLRDVGRSPYLAGIGGFVLCTAIAATFIYLQQAGIAKHALPDTRARADFFANVDIAVNSIALVLQALVAARLFAWLGAGPVLAILPVIQGVGLIALIAAPALATVAVVQVAGRSVQHGLIRPGRELLFTVVSRDQKYRAKNVIDTLIYRFGDVGSSWLSTGLLSIGTGALLGVAMPVAGVWLVTAILLGVGYRRRRTLELAKDPG